MPENTALGFDSNEYTSEGEFYRSNSPEQLRLDEKRNYAFGGGLLKGITELPLELLEMMSPADEYVPGALAPDQSSPRQRLRTERLHGEQFYDELKADPDTAQAAEVGYGTSFVVDPIIDTGIGLAPHLIKGMKLISKGERAAPKLANLMSDEVGAIGDIAKAPEKLAPYVNDLFKGESKTMTIGDETKIGDFGNIKAYEQDYKTPQGRSVRYTMEDDNGDTLGVLQILAEGKRSKKAKIANVTVHPDARRKGIATELLNQAKQDFKIKHSDDLTTQGELWKKSLGKVKEPIPVDLSKQSLSEVFSEARAASLKNAEELGYTTDAYTGSTHDIKAFEGSLANPENDWGRGTYASTSIDDVNANYAGEGPDLTSRIQQRSERIADDLADDDYVRDELLEEHGISLDDYEADEAGVAETIARKELTGPAEGGVIYPLKIKAKDYAVIGGDNATVLRESEGFDDLAKSEIDEADFDDVDEYEDAILTRVDELKFEDEDSLYNKVNGALQDSDLWQEESTIQEVMDALQDGMLEGEIRIDDIDDAIRSHATEVYDDNGEMLSAGEISSQVIKNLGFDGVVDTQVYGKFGGGRKYGQAMEGLDPDTAHIVTFPGKESTIRSRHAKFDPANIRSKDILATAAGASIALSAATREPQPVDMSKTTLREVLGR